MRVSSGPTALDRVAGGLRIDSTIAVGDVTWTKVDDNRWEDGRGRPANNREMDVALADGAEIVFDVVDLDVEEVEVFDLQPGDYVVVTVGFNEDGERPDPEFPFFGDNCSQQLWRVAGWTWHGEQSSTIVFDAPDEVMAAANAEGAEPVEFYVEPGEKIHLVQPGQEHQTWEHDYVTWYSQYTFVECPR